MEVSIKRDAYLKKLIDKRENGAIKVITGLRRSGKSYLLFDIFYNYLLSEKIPEKRIVRLALDNEKNAALRDPDKLSEFLYSKITDQKRTFFVLLDEIQFAISKEELKNNQPLKIYGILNGLLSLKNVDVYVTGSNSKFLSSDISTEFRGRGDEVHVNPLSFGEFFSVYNGNKYEAWEEYSLYGGMPRLFALKTAEEKAKYLSDLFKETYVKDIIERYNLRSDVVLDTLIDVLASSIGSLNNATKIAKTFESNGIKTSDKTVNSYIEYLEDAFLIRKSQRYDIKGRKYINSPFKFYFSDIGLRNARLNFRQQEPTHIMENVIYNELIYRGFNVDVGIVDYYPKESDGKQHRKTAEVDFVCNKASKRYYIQSAYSIPTVEKMRQEETSLEKIGDSFKKIIVTSDIAKPWQNEKGHTIINVIDFLLNPASLDF